MFKAVIFDMDGVLFDSESFSMDLYAEICLKRGYDLKNLVKNTLGLTYESTRTYYLSKLGNDFPYEETSLELQDMLINMAKEHKLPIKKNVVETLEYLQSKNIKVGLASSNNKISIFSYIEIYNMLKFFDVFVTGDDVSECKP